MILLGLLIPFTPMRAHAEEPRTTVTRLPIRQEKLQPVTIVPKQAGCYFIDFGQDAFGGLELEIRKPEAGRKIVVHMGEAISAPETINRKPAGSIRYWTTELTLRADQQVYTVPLRPADKRLMSEQVGPVMPFRYVELENAPHLGKNDVRQVMAFYPFDTDAADFKCSDPGLVAIWEMCKHTIKATSFGGVFIDGDRERKPYEADAYINQLGWYCCTGDLTLPRYSHEYLVTHPTWPTEWIMFSVLMAWEDYRYTGDTASLTAFYDDLKAKTLIALERDDGLISTTGSKSPGNIHIGKITDIVDWPAGERDRCEMKPVNTVVNAFHCRALRLMANLAATVRNHDDEVMFGKAADKAIASLNGKLIDTATGLYVDGEGSHHSSLHANLFPLVFGLVPPANLEKVSCFVKSRGMACSVYGAQFLMEALFDYGMADHAMALMTADSDRSWTHMIKRVGSTLAMEAWDIKYKGNLDWNHAWGAAPANILPRKVLGIEPADAGFRKILIHPHPGNLQWAEGRVPTKAGSVAVRVEQNATGLRLKIDIPPAATARVELPKSPGANLMLDGKIAPVVVTAACLVLDHLGPGKHDILLRR